MQCTRVYAGSQGLGVHDSSAAVASDSLAQGGLPNDSLELSEVKREHQIRA